MSSKNLQIGHLPPKYSFAINEYIDYRASKCPRCNHNTFNRKFALLIVGKEIPPLALGYTCKYCAKCEFIIVHKNELDFEVREAYRKSGQDIKNKEYFVIGTIDKKIWEKHIGKATDFSEQIKFLADFRERLEIGFSPGGWYK